MPTIAIGTMLGAGSAVATRAARLVAGEDQYLAVNFLDMSALVRDTATPANNFSGHPNNLLTYTSPFAKWVRLSNGLYASGTSLRTEYDESGTALGLPIEEARTALAIRARELGHATYWTRSGIEASDVQGVDGVLASATRLTATSGNGTVLGSSNTSASAARRLAPFVRRVAGTGGLEWTLDGGTTWTAFAGITSSWQRLGVGQTVANPRVGFRIVSSGDAFDVDFANGETGSYDTSPLHVDGATAVVTRAADAISLATSKFPWSGVAGTLVARGSTQSVAAGVQANLVLVTSATSAPDQYVLYQVGGAAVGLVTTGLLCVPSGTVAVATPFSLGMAYATNDLAVSLNGGAPATDASGTPQNVAAVLFVGGHASNSSNLRGHLQWLLYVPRRVNDAGLQAKTT